MLPSATIFGKKKQERKTSFRKKDQKRREGGGEEGLGVHRLLVQRRPYMHGELTRAVEHASLGCPPKQTPKTQFPAQEGVDELVEMLQLLP